MWSLQLLRLVHFTGAGTGDVTVFAIYSVSYYLQVCTCHILFTSLQIFHVPIPVHCILSFLRDSLLIILRIVFLLIFSHVPKFIILSLNSLQCAYVTIYISLNGIFHSASAWMSSRFTDLDEKNTFCGNDWETFIHLFCSCHVSFKCCWKTYFRKKNWTCNHSRSQGYFHKIYHILLVYKFHLHETRYSKSLPFPSFQIMAEEKLLPPSN